MSSRAGSPNSRAAFRHGPFRLYWGAQVISLMGTFMQGVALGFLVYGLTGSKVLLGVISALQMGPSLFLSLPAGVVADRVDRRKLILGTQSTALLLAFSLATLIALHRLHVWEIVVISALSGIAIAVESPTRQSFVIDLVGREDLPNAIAWNSLAINGARVLGPAVGGIAIEIFGVAPIFYYNSVSFLAVILALILMRLPDRERVARATRPLRDLGDGLRYVANAPAIVSILVLVAAVATFAMNFNVLMPILARDSLHTNAGGLGWMWTAMGLGAVLGSATVVRWSTAAVGGGLLLGNALVAGLAELSMAEWRSMPITLLALVVVGWSTGAFFAGANSAIQHRVTDDVRGRVVSVYSMIFAGTGPVGGLLTAGLARAGGPALALAVGGGTCAAAGLLIALPFRHALRGEVARRAATAERRAG